MASPRRFAVIGTSGSGKTTLARQLSEILGIAHVELDALHWEQNWTPASTEVFQSRVAAAAAQDSWVFCGNYRQARDLIWPRAEVLVWLDYPLHIALARTLKRTIRRVFFREQIWNGNRESFRQSFLSGKSILLWTLNTHARRKREYAKLLSRPEFKHLQIKRLASPSDTNMFIEGLRAASAGILNHRKDKPA